MDIELSKLDRQIIELIDEVRAVNHSVTARHLAAQLRIHNSHISRRLRDLRERGYVDFNEKMPGAIWVTGTIDARINDEGQLVPIASIVANTSSVGATRPIQLGVHVGKMKQPTTWPAPSQQPGVATSEPPVVAVADVIVPSDADVAKVAAIKAQRLDSLAKARAAKVAKKTAEDQPPK